MVFPSLKIRWVPADVWDASVVTGLCVAVFYMIAPWLQTLLESQDAWILFVVAALVLYCLIEELRCQHPHSLCIFCICDGLLSQKVYDPLYVVIEEFLYIPLCVVAEELYYEIAGFVQGIVSLVRHDGHRWTSSIL